MLVISEMALAEMHISLLLMEVSIGLIRSAWVILEFTSLGTTVTSIKDPHLLPTKKPLLSFTKAMVLVETPMYSKTMEDSDGSTM
jgi:hypothetical protein